MLPPPPAPPLPPLVSQSENARSLIWQGLNLHKTYINVSVNAPHALRRIYFVLTGGKHARGEIAGGEGAEGGG